jgi:hypothetical protein
MSSVPIGQAAAVADLDAFAARQVGGKLAAVSLTHCF